MLCRVRRRIVELLQDATDVVFSHFHGDHVPLKHANFFQLSFEMLPEHFSALRIWSKNGDESHPRMRRRFHDLQELAGSNLSVVEGCTEGPMSFSHLVPHGEAETHLGAVMMTRIDLEDKVFVHASDIQLLNIEALNQIIRWQPDIVLTGGPPLYLDYLKIHSRENAWDNALQLANSVDTLIIDHHLMRSKAGVQWLKKLSQVVSGKISCAADFMERPRLLLEARREELYETIPVPDNWMDDYIQGKAEAESFLITAVNRGVIPPAID